MEVHDYVEKGSWIDKFTVSLIGGLMYIPVLSSAMPDPDKGSSSCKS
jgi:hypothetical protein